MLDKILEYKQTPNKRGEVQKPDQQERKNDPFVTERKTKNVRWIPK